MEEVDGPDGDEEGQKGNDGMSEEAVSVVHVLLVSQGIGVRKRRGRWRQSSDGVAEREER